MDVREFARNPVRAARQQPVTGALLIWLALVALVYARQQALPTQRQFVSLAIGTAAVVLVASVAPDLVTWILLATLVVSVFGQPEGVVDLAERGFAQLRAALVPHGVGSPQPVPVDDPLAA
ncbi:MAG: hypothetical protein DDT21_02421 [Syntrophomonadaceae bacterium]|nr:hypothetical protein [Bacillota bacterium]